MQELLSSSSRIICRGAEDHNDFHPKYVPLLSPAKSYLRNKKEKKSHHNAQKINCSFASI